MRGGGWCGVVVEVEGVLSSRGGFGVRCMLCCGVSGLVTRLRLRLRLRAVYHGR